MPLSRKFIDWKQPILPAAADWLIERYVAENTFRGDEVLVVLPGRRAGRVLLELLVQRAEQRGLVFLPPSLTTIGNLPERLYEPQRPFAGRLLQRTAWVEALRSLPGEQLQRIVAQLPDETDVDRWFELGELLWRQHRELAGDSLDFADVAGMGSEFAGEAEVQRWKLLAGVQRRYLDLVGGLNLWDRQTARLVAIEENECHTDSQTVLIATADMNRSTKKMLDQVADHVTCLIHAPDALADRFDRYGCLIAEAWQEAEIPLDAADVHVVGGPADQSTAVANALAAHDGRYGPDEITIGVPDDGLVPQLERTLKDVGVRTRYGVGRPVPQTLPFQLLDAVAIYIAGHRYTALASLIRHADVHRWLLRQGVSSDWLTELDNYYCDHLPAQLTEWLGRPEDSQTIREIRQKIDQAVAPLRAKAQTLPEWATCINEVLLAFYGDLPLDHNVPDERETLETFERFRDVLLEFRSLPAAVSTRYEVGAAVGLFLDELRKVTIPPPPDEDAVELRGWLELPTDPAPALVVTSLNEGFVPESLNADLFLPNALRRRLRILDNQRRYARDAYALSVLLASRERLTLVAGRFNSQGDPLTPSRLLFACEPQTAAQRARMFFDEKLSGTSVPSAPKSGGRSESAFHVPRPTPTPKPLEYMSVTAFRNYLACPYRFYLGNVLKLGAVDDSHEELSAAVFGTLIHDVLRHFGESHVRDSTDDEAISRFLHETLERRAAAQFGRDHLPAVHIQLQNIRTRLEAFARWQAAWRSSGWRIERIEKEEGADRFDLLLDDGRMMKVGGRIDRIDRNDETGECLVLDYKTSDSPKNPDQAHRKGGEWFDLQLPLYRHLSRAIGIEGPIKLGYIVLPKSSDQVDVKLAEWSDGELDEADAEARRVAQLVLDQVFWPPADETPFATDEFAGICQGDVFDRQLEGDDEGGPR